MKYRIAIVGASGVVGRKTLRVLEERKLQNNDYVLYASKRSAGKKVLFAGKKHRIIELNRSIFEEKFDFALFCTKEDVSKNYTKKLAEGGTKVVDFSSFYRKRYPLIVPEINAERAKGNLICNPNCSTIAGVMALYEIHRRFGLKRVVYSTYQAVSGAGKDALDDLIKRRKKNLRSFDFPIFNNLICQIGCVGKNGYSKEENKMIYETKKILQDRNISVTATCVRVPIDVCHSESINFETRKRCSLGKLVETLKNTQGVIYLESALPMPLFVRGKDEVFVGRLRKDYGRANTFNMFVVSDNLRKGAAQNGVQILEEMIKRQGR